MWVRLVEDGGVCAMPYECLQRLVVVAAFLAACEELTIGERARATLTKGVVRVGVDVATAVNLRDVALTREHRLAALKEYGLETELYEAQRCEESCRTRAYDDNLRTRIYRGVVEVQGCGLRLLVDIYLERQVYLGHALTSVDGALDYAREGNLALLDAEALGGTCYVELLIGSLLGR